MQPIDWYKESITPVSFPAGYGYTTLSSVWQNQIPLFWLGGLNFYRPAYYAGPGWAPQLSPAAVQPYAAASQVATTTTVQNNLTTYYSDPYLVRAAVDFPNPDAVDARVSNGTAFANFSYRINALNTYGNTQDYFLTFPVPKATRIYTVPYSLSSAGDYNGGTYSYVNPKFVSSTNAIDVYVDGLPVYSSAGFFDHARTYANAFQKLETSFGQQIFDPNVLIYLGKIPAGGSFTVDLVIRAEATADSSTCGTTYLTGYSGNKLEYNCLDMNERISIPESGSGISFKVFSMVLN